MSESRLVFSREVEWFWQAPHNANPSASSRKQSSNKKRRQRLRREVLERDGYLCAYCPDAATTVDHIVSLAKGGEDTAENMVPACDPCNRTLGWLGL